MKKTYIIIGVVVAVLVVAYFVFNKNKTAVPAGVDPDAKVGTRKNGNPYTEKDIAKTIGDIKGSPDWFAVVKQKATAQGISLDEMLRKDAIYMFENV